MERQKDESYFEAARESCPIGNWSLFASTGPGEQGLIRLIKEIRGTMSSLRDARVANLDCRLIKKKKNSFLRADLRTDFHPPEIAFSFKDVDDEISKDFGNILCKYHDSNLSSYFLFSLCDFPPFCFNSLSYNIRYSCNSD